MTLFCYVAFILISGVISDSYFVDTCAVSLCVVFRIMVVMIHGSTTTSSIGVVRVAMGRTASTRKSDLLSPFLTSIRTFAI